jgi:hypothetical protein
MIPARLLRVVLNSQLFADGVRCNVLASVVTEFAVIHPSSGLIRKLNFVVPRDPSQVVVKSYPPAGIHGTLGSGPGAGRSQFREKVRHGSSLSIGHLLAIGVG